MANYINKYSDLAAYNADETKEYPNVSYLEVEDEVKWQATEPKIVAKYDVTDTSNPTKLLNNTANITYMMVDGVQQPSVTTGYTFSTTGTHTVKYKVNSNWDGESTFKECFRLTVVTIPDSVTLINNYAFYNCSNLTSVTIPDSVTSIYENVFYGCTSLTSMNIPSGVTNIGNRAFQSCKGLTSVIIPNSVTSIGNNAFSNCTGLTSVTVEATTPATLGSMAFDNTNNCPIYVPSASVNAYKTASVWSTYASRIQAIQ